MGNSKIEARSFTARVPIDMFTKIEEAQKLGKWNTNQLMNIALDTFFEIIEAEKGDRKMPLAVATLRDMKKRAVK